MTREEFITIAQDAGVDEVWVDFANPFEGEHNSSTESIYICAYHKKIGDPTLARASVSLHSFFAPKMMSEEEEEIMQVDSQAHIVTNERKDYMEDFFERKENLTLVYRDGEGFIE